MRLSRAYGALIATALFTGVMRGNAAAQSQAADNPATAESVVRYHPEGGSGIVGSEELRRLTAQWRPMATSRPKQAAAARFRHNKYGMFIHFGLYSELGGIWKGRTLEDSGTGPRLGEWIMRRHEIGRDEYAQLARTFDPSRFDARQWVAIAKAAGMRYIVVTSKHHDGFALFKSTASRFNVVDATPFRRDIIKELSDACAEAGLAFGVYYSQALDWRDGGDAGYRDYAPRTGPKIKGEFPNRWDPSPQSYDDYTMRKAIPQVQELLQNYRISQIWFDTPVYIPPKYSMLFYKTVFNSNPSILVNQRVGNGFGDIGVPGDNVIPDSVREGLWEGIATTNNSWGYKSYDHDWKSSTELLYWLLATVSKGGNFLLNVGPDGQGVIPAGAVTHLTAIGQWLQVNGPAIYDSRPWRTSHEGPTRISIRGTEDREAGKPTFTFTPQDFWFTQRGDRLFAIGMVAPPAGQSGLITSLANTRVRNVRLLGSTAPIWWRSTAAGLEFKLSGAPASSLGYTLEIRL